MEITGFEGLREVNPVLHRVELGRFIGRVFPESGGLLLCQNQGSTFIHLQMHIPDAHCLLVRVSSNVLTVSFHDLTHTSPQTRLG